MGFGSYDESEQQNHDINTDDVADDDSGIDRETATHEGSIEFEHPSDTDALLDRLRDMRDDETDEDDSETDAADKSS